MTNDDLYDQYKRMLERIDTRTSAKATAWILRVVIDSRMKHKCLSKESFIKAFNRQKKVGLDYEYIKTLQEKSSVMSNNDSEEYIDPNDMVSATYVIFWAGALEAIRRQVQDTGVALNTTELLKASSSIKALIVDMLRKADKQHLLEYLGHENKDNTEVES